MKKILALLILCCMVFSVLAVSACNKGGNTSQKPSIVTRSSKSVTTSSNSTVSTDPGESSTTPPESTDPGASSTNPPESTTPPASSTTPPESSTTPPESSTNPGSSTGGGTIVDPPVTGEVLVTTEPSVKNDPYVSNLRIENAGTYYLGSLTGANYIFKFEVTSGGATHTFNATDITPFAKTDGKLDGEEITTDSGYFALICKATKTAVEGGQNKTFADGYNGTARVNFGGKSTESVTGSGIYYNAIRFAVTAAADVKIWWVSGGPVSAEDPTPRQVNLIKGGEPSATPASVTAFINAANAIGEVTEVNYAEKATLITAAETAYAAVPVANQADADVVSAKATVDAARTAYDGFDAAAQAAANQAAANAVIEQINAIGTVTLESKTAIEGAETSYAALTETQKGLVTNYATLTAARAEYDALKLAADNQAISELITEITAIGEVTKVNYTEKLSAIEAAEAKFAALNEDKRVEVTNSANLTAARAAYDRFAAIKVVEDQITAIGTVDDMNYTEKLSAIETAETAFNELSADDQAIVENSATLTAARAAYDAAKLAADQAAAAAVDALIAAIGTVDNVNYTEKLSAIEAAETAYDALDETQQALVTGKATLDAARAAYNDCFGAAKAQAFIAAVNEIGLVDGSNYTTKGAYITIAKDKYAQIPESHTSLAEVTTAKATLDAADTLVINYTAYVAYKAKYDTAVAAGIVTSSNQATFQAAIDAYATLTADQKALATDAAAEQANITAWGAAIAALVPAEPTNTTFSFESDSTGWTAKIAGGDVPMKYVNSVSGYNKAWQTSNQYKSTTVVFETDQTFNDVTRVSLFVGSSGGSGVTYYLYVGSTPLGSCNASSSGFSTSRVINYSGPAVSGKIRIEAVIGASNRGPGIDEVSITHVPA